MSARQSAVVRRAREADLDAIMAIAGETQNAPWTRQMFVDELNRASAELLVAVQAGNVVAFIIAWVVVDELQILNVATRADVRRTGLAQLLLGELLSTARTAGCTSARLEVRLSNLPAQRLYERAGFARVSVRRGYYSDNGEDAVNMACSISSGRLP